MPRRTADWNEGLAQDLKDPKFARLFIEASIEEGISIQAVLAKVIRAYGIKEFSAKVKIPSPNLIRSISERHNPTLQTLNRLLKPFGLEVSVSKIQGRKAG